MSIDKKTMTQIEGGGIPFPVPRITIEKRQALEHIGTPDIHLVVKIKNVVISDILLVKGLDTTF